ncbi:hypothetical protein WKW50_24730, partial [Ochrobactrum sp. GPK 3]
SIKSAAAFLYAASVMLLVRRLARINAFKTDSKRSHVLPSFLEFFQIQECPAQCSDEARTGLAGSSSRSLVYLFRFHYCREK